MASKASTSDSIKNITRSGTTFTATRANGTTFTFTQQDNNSTYPDAIKSITRSGTTFTATRYSGGTFTFTQQDNNTNTTYSFTTLQASGSFSGNGWKKLTKAIPSGYVALGGLYQPVDIYASGHEMANITDRNCTVSGSTLTINFYLYNPANVNLNVVATCLFFKTN